MDRYDHNQDRYIDRSAIITAVRRQAVLNGDLQRLCKRIHLISILQCSLPWDSAFDDCITVSDKVIPPVVELGVATVDLHAMTLSGQCDSCRWRLNTVGGHVFQIKRTFLEAVELQPAGVE